MNDTLRNHIPRQLLPSRPHMGSENLRHNVASNESDSTKAMTINLGDPHSMSLLLRLLEKQLDKHIDNNKCV